MSEISKRYYQAWSDLTPEQQAKGSRQEHSARREELGLKGVNVELDTKARMAGDAIVQMNRSEEPNKDAIAAAREVVYGGGLEGFDPTAAGSGALGNQNKFSAADIRGVLKAEKEKTGDKKVAMQNILDYVEANPEMNSGGDRAQKLLNDFRDKLGLNGGEDTQPGEGEGGSGGGGEGTQPGGGGGDTQPGGGGEGPYDESLWDGDSPGSTEHFVKHFSDLNRDRQKYWDDKASTIAHDNWRIFGKDNDAEYDAAMTGIDKEILNAHSNSTFWNGMLYGDFTRYKTPNVVMDWDPEPVDTDLEDDDIDFD